MAGRQRGEKEQGELETRRSPGLGGGKEALQAAAQRLALHAPGAGECGRTQKRRPRPALRKAHGAFFTEGDSADPVTQQMCCGVVEVFPGQWWAPCTFLRGEEAITKL